MKEKGRNQILAENSHPMNKTGVVINDDDDDDDALYPRDDTERQYISRKEDSLKTIQKISKWQKPGFFFKRYTSRGYTITLTIYNILRKWIARYKVSWSQEKINHLMYMDDITLFTKKEKEPET